MTEEYPIKVPRKLIEVALPLDEINEACAYEKLPGIGAHPRSMHLWWARRPLAAARAIIFAQLVNDPGFQQGEGFRYGVNKRDAVIERQRLFGILRELAKWQNVHDEGLLQQARDEITRSWSEVCNLNKDHPDAVRLFDPSKPPALHDPFAGGGAIPLEAQRLGLEAYATDLNPVSVLINTSMIVVPPLFKNKAPVGLRVDDDDDGSLRLERSWLGISGLAEDIRRYGVLLEKSAREKLDGIFPEAIVTEDIARDREDLEPMIGAKLPVLAWMWTRTVRSPNPAFSDCEVPLASTYVLSTKRGKKAYVVPQVNGSEYTFVVKKGEPSPAARKGARASARGANFQCVLSGSPISAEYIRSEARAGRLGMRLMAIVAKGRRGKLYLTPSAEAEEVATTLTPEWLPNTEFFQQALGFRIGNYGMTKWSDLYTPRQLVVLTTLCNLIQQMHSEIKTDALRAEFSEDETPLESEGRGARAYADAICLYLTFAVSRLADFGCSLATWKPSGEQVMHLFTRQAIPMNWDFPESNLLGSNSICLGNALKYIHEGLLAGEVRECLPGHASQADAQDQSISRGRIISTDPPYFDNIGYADLSDFFYVWLRYTLRDQFPSLLSTITVPKEDELVATPARHGGRESSNQFFLRGMSRAIENLAVNSHPAFPITIYYAFKQSETSADGGTSSTGWETFLNAVLKSGLTIAGTWPLRSEQEFRMRGMGANALASSIVLVCKKRPRSAPSVSRREFIRELNRTLPDALDEMTRGVEDEQSPVAPVDLSQSILGPGMAVFSKYSAVLEADGSQMSVRTALQLINRFLVEDDFDADTQFCLHWFEQHGWDSDVFGTADVLARAKATSVDGLADAGVIESGGGSVRLLKWTEYPSDWDPNKDFRTPVWEALHHLIRALKQGGESAAGQVLEGVASKAEAARQLAYRLYTLCERKGWAEDARAYNELITSWSAIESAAPKVAQQELF